MIMFRVLTTQKKRSIMDNVVDNPTIKGWGTFFLFQLGLCAIIMVMSFVSDFNIYNYDLGLSGNIRLNKSLMNFGAICDIVPIISIILYAILTIRCFIKRKSFVIQLSMAYLLALIINVDWNLLTVILCYNTDVFTIIAYVFGMTWLTIWLLYLNYSKYIDKLFPILERTFRKRDYLPILLIDIPPIIWMLFALSY